jgi:hypothetical protein
MPRRQRGPLPDAFGVDRPHCWRSEAASRCWKSRISGTGLDGRCSVESHPRLRVRGQAVSQHLANSRSILASLNLRSTAHEAQRSAESSPPPSSRAVIAARATPPAPRALVGQHVARRGRARSGLGTMPCPAVDRGRASASGLRAGRTAVAAAAADVGRHLPAWLV